MRRVLVVAALLIAAAFFPFGDAQASSPGWLVSCPFSHTAAEDPIVFPGADDLSHQHDFLGNRSVAAGSTYASMTQATTTCRSAADTAGYWVPALYRNGVKISPSGSMSGVNVREQIYYRDNNLAPGTKIRAFPADLRMVAGNSHARSVAENPKLGKEIYFGCSDNSTGKLTAPPASCATGIMTIHYGFPNCWDGVLTHQNDTAHMAYPSSGKCPSAFPIALPRVIERLEYPVSKSTGTIFLASGATWTAHADFWNTWKQTELERLVAACLNVDNDCGKLGG
jgi:hypothetical protein